MFGSTQARLGLTLVFAAMLAAVLIPQYLALQVAAKVADEKLQLQKMLRNLGGLARRQHDDRGRAIASDNSVYVPYGPDGSAEAGLRQYLSDLVSLHGGIISSSEFSPVLPAEAGIRISLRLESRIPVGSIKPFLKDLEAGSPILLMERFSTSTETGDQSVSGSADMLMTLEVSGFSSRARQP